MAIPEAQLRDPAHSTEAAGCWQGRARLSDGSFLIVLNQVGYRLDLASWASLATAARGSLGRDATVLACHDQHEFAERILDTQTLHGILDSILGLTRQTQVIDADFTIDVWTNRPAPPRG